MRVSVRFGEHPSVNLSPNAPLYVLQLLLSLNPLVVGVNIGDFLLSHTAVSLSLLK